MTFAEKVAISMNRSMAKNDAKHKAGQTLPTGVGVTEYAYLPDGHEMHKLNVYRPSNAKSILPLIIDIHGGAWVYGDKELNKGMCMYYASLGYCVAGMSYRLVPEVQLIDQVHDVFASLNFIAEHAAEWGADPSNVMLTGDSAGGHLSSLALCICLSPELREIYGVTVPKLDIKCLVMSHPVCEVHSIMRAKDFSPSKHFGWFQRTFEPLLFGADPSNNKIYNYASFTQYSRGVTLPPVMIIGCERDVYGKHSKFLNEYISDMVKQGRCKSFKFEYTSKKQEKDKLCHVFEVVYPMREDSVRVLNAASDFFKSIITDKEK